MIVQTERGGRERGAPAKRRGGGRRAVATEYGCNGSLQHICNNPLPAAALRPKGQPVGCTGYFCIYFWSLRHSVVRSMPSSRAARVRLPPQARRAASSLSFSLSGPEACGASGGKGAGVAARRGGTSSMSSGCRALLRSAEVRTSRLRRRTAARSTTLRSSRALPAKGYSRSRWSESGATSGRASRFFQQNFLRKK